MNCSWVLYCDAGFLINCFAPCGNDFLLNLVIERLKRDSMETTYLVVGITLGILQVIALLAGWFKFYTKMAVYLTTLDGRISKIEAQYVPNGGSSMRDAVNRIETKIAKLEGKFEQHVDENLI